MVRKWLLVTPVKSDGTISKRPPPPIHCWLFGYRSSSSSFKNQHWIGAGGGGGRGGGSKLGFGASRLLNELQLDMFPCCAQWSVPTNFDQCCSYCRSDEILNVLHTYFQYFIEFLDSFEETKASELVRHASRSLEVSPTIFWYLLKLSRAWQHIMQWLSCDLVDCPPKPKLFLLLCFLGEEEAAGELGDRNPGAHEQGKAERKHSSNQCLDLRSVCALEKLSFPRIESIASACRSYSSCVGN